MRDTALPIRKAYIEKLKNAVLLGAKVVPIFDNVPKKEDYPYILIHEQSSIPGNSSRGCTIDSTTIRLDIVTGYPGNAGGHANADKIGDTVILLVTAGLTDPLGFQIISAEPELNYNMPVEEVNGYKIYRKQLRFRNEITEV